MTQLLLSCSVVKDHRPARAIDPTTLAKLSDSSCPQGTQFKLFASDYEIYSQEPAGPLLYGVKKGKYACAIESNYQSNGLTAWLTVAIPNDCLENGSLWQRTHLSRFDGNKVVAKFQRLDLGFEDQQMTISTNEGHPYSEIRDGAGLYTYTCQP